MNAIDLFGQLGELENVRWRSKAGHVVRIDRREGEVLHVSVELATVGTWIPDSPWSVDAFLASHVPVRPSR